jgi:ABC-2 type transport system ATP-binding protein
MTNLAIQLQGVCKHYRHFDLDHVDLELPAGNIMGFIGANGAGKSTTIRILLGLVHQDRGKVQVLGHRLPDQQAAAKLDIGFVSEDMRLYGAATIRWHMEFIRSIFPGWNQAYADKLLKSFDLKSEQKIKGLSHGQRVKAALLLALAHQPRLLVLDEPTTGLDPIARHEVLSELMNVLRDEERTILFSSHNTQDVEQISDIITFIDRGKIVSSADKETFLEQWRRLRLALPHEGEVPRLPGVIGVGGSLRLPVLTTNHFDPAMVNLCRDLGASVEAVETMTLEEIFVASVQHRKEEKVTA